jgi:hypothetical protein
MQHLCALSHVVIEDRAKVIQALAHVQIGLDLADAMHYASYSECASMATFDDKKFARKAQKFGFKPRVFIPQAQAPTF